MPTIPLPPSERLLITIDREVSVECARCNGSGVIKGDPITSLTMQARCPTCHGTGRIKRRLRGWCEVDLEQATHTDPASIYVPVKIGDGLAEQSIDSYRVNGDEIRRDVIAAYLDGTLPDEIAANIEITDIEESA